MFSESLSQVVRALMAELFASIIAHSSGIHVERMLYENSGFWDVEDCSGGGLVVGEVGVIVQMKGMTTVMVEMVVEVMV